MSILLGLVYAAMGFVMGIAAATAAGFACASGIALVRIGRQAGNWCLFALYALLGCIAAGVVWAGLVIAGLIGDRTGYSSQLMLIGSLVVFGLMSLAPVVRGFIKVSLAQTGGGQS